MIQTLIVGFSNFYFIGIFGDRHWNPTLTLFTVMAIHRIYLLMILLWDYHKKNHPTNSTTVKRYIFRLAINILVAIVVVYLLVDSKFLRGQNIYC